LAETSTTKNETQNEKDSDMKIIKNTSGRSTREIKKIFTHVHRYMKKLEGRAAPNWKGLRVIIEGREDNYHSGRAYFHGHGGDWDVFLTLPRPTKKGTLWHNKERKGQPNYYGVHTLASLVYHELMHTYGYRHSEYNDITEPELNKLFPETYDIPAQPEPKARLAALPKWQTKYNRLLARRKTWESKQRRAKVALKKLETQIKYYERTYID